MIRATIFVMVRIASVLAMTSALACGNGGGDPDGGGSPCEGVAFGAEHTFALPGGYGPAFVSIGNPTCTGALPGYATIDLTGDGLPDLVVTDLCGDGVVGESHWLLHRGDGTRFADAAATFALPGGYGPAFVSIGNPTCTGALPGYATIDLTSDGLPDLVVTDLCGDGVVGESHWLLHRNTGNGFTATAEMFALPGGYGPAFISTGNPTCTGALPGYATIDLTGDGLPDLVVTDLCGDGVVGDAHWLLHRNIGNGFAATVETFALPSGYGPAFVSTANPSCAGALPGFATIDLTGDRLPDLVVTDLCGDGVVGDAHWLLHRNVGDGFGDAATFALPPGYGAAFTSVGRTSSCGGGFPAFGTFDLVGDLRPDLVVTDACDDDVVGTDHWLHYRNDGTRFAGSASEFHLPPGYDQLFVTPSSGGGCTGASHGFATLDVNADSRPDLVVTDLCGDGVVGEAHWLVHFNECAP